MAQLPASSFTSLSRALLTLLLVALVGLTACDDNVVDPPVTGDPDPIDVEVSGTVSADADGSAVAGADVAIFRGSSGGDELATTTTDAAGAYTLSFTVDGDDTPSSFQITTSADGFLPFEDQLNFEPSIALDITLEAIDPGEAIWRMFGQSANRNGRSSVSSTASGTEAWSFEAGGQFLSSTAIGADGTLYAGSGDGQLYAIRPDGSERWSFETGGSVLSSPAIGFDGTIYVGSNDGRLYAVNPDGTEKWSCSKQPGLGTESWW